MEMIFHCEFCLGVSNGALYKISWRTALLGTEMLCPETFLVALLRDRSHQGTSPNPQLWTSGKGQLYSDGKKTWLINESSGQEG